jgi:hypothetical protein
MGDVVFGAAVEIGPRQVEIVLLGLQHAHALVVEVKKFLQVFEIVCLPQVLDARVGDLDAVPARDLEHQLGLEGALDVQVQLGLGQVGDQVGHRPLPVDRVESLLS